MSSTFAVDLSKMSRTANVAIVMLCTLFAVAGYFVSFYFHFLTVDLPPAGAAERPLAPCATFAHPAGQLRFSGPDPVSDRERRSGIPPVTHGPHLQRGLDIEDEARRVANYVETLHHDHMELLAAMGKTSTRRLGAADLIAPPLAAAGGPADRMESP